MFWTETLRQLGLFGDDELQGCNKVCDLVAFSKKHFPECDSNFHRQFAFLTHRASQCFLSPLLVNRFGSIDAAKVPTLDWLDSVGSLETIARSTRSGVGGKPDGAVRTRRVPDWYTAYCHTGRYQEMKQRAEQWWLDYMGELTCSENARHEYEVMHHRDYGRVGEGDEFRFLVPKCNECHNQMRARGPALPEFVPEAVKKWL